MSHKQKRATKLPFNKLHVPRDLAVETCQTINRHLHAALVDTCGVHTDDDFCLICRYAPEDMAFHPTFLGALLGGRTDAQKEALYADMRARLGSIGFPPENAIIFLIENAAIDWSFGPQGSVKTVLGL